jgi:hypothetical protein
LKGGFSFLSYQECRNEMRVFQISEIVLHSAHRNRRDFEVYETQKLKENEAITWMKIMKFFLKSKGEK